MRIAITGASGLIGGAISQHLSDVGHTVHPLVRRTPDESKNEIYWKPSSNEIDSTSLEGINVMIHLAGESIAGRWTDAKKKRIRDSRVAGTTLVAETIASLNSPPDLFLSASAVGFYGDRGSEELTESSQGGKGFLPKVCFAWEAAAYAAEKSGIRTVHPRFGLVLSDKGGALETMLLPFKMGVGGVVGSGEQYMSWIAIEDAVLAITHILSSHDIVGPVNLVAPHPVTNREFTKTLGKQLGRPTILPLPSPIVKMMMGEMGESLLLDSTRVLPQTLLRTGYSFKYRDLAKALAEIL